MPITYGTPQAAANAQQEGEQRTSSVAALKDGFYVVTWTSDTTERDYRQVVGQVFNERGERVGGEFFASKYAGSMVDNAQVAALDDGGFAIAYQFSGIIMVRRFTAYGSPHGDDQIVPTTTGGHMDYASITALDDGGFVVMWENFSPPSGGYGIFAQRYDSSGNPAGTEISVAASGSEMGSPDIARVDGGFVAVWTEYNGQYRDLRAQLYGADGTPDGEAFMIHGGVDGSQRNSVVATLADGGFVVAWRDTDPDVDAIVAQRFDAAGEAMGERTIVRSQPSVPSMHMDITALPDGGFVVGWSEYGGARIRRFDANGAPIGEPMPLDSRTSYGGVGQDPALATHADGSFIATWTAPDASTYWSEGIFASRFRSADTGYMADAPERVMGSSDGDFIWGFGGDDEIRGGEGDDTLEGGEGADFIVGGAGWDEASYSGAMAGVAINLQNNSHSGEASGDRFETVEQFRLSRFGDRFIGGANGDIAYGEGGDDLMIGGGGDDVLEGGLGNDSLEGGMGADMLAGGDGDDEATYARSAAAVQLNLQTGDHSGDAAGDGFSSIERFTLSRFGDGFTGSDEVDRVWGGAGADILRGMAGSDDLDGGEGNDVLDGGAGADRMSGGLGNDVFHVDNAADKVEDSGGASDTVRTSVSFKLGGTVAIETLTAADSAATGALVLTGNGFAQTIVGAAGADTINGAAGADTMIGGKGGDRYVVDNAGDKVIELNGEGTDTVESSVSFSLAGQYVEVLKLTGTAAIKGTGNSLANTIVGNNEANVIDGGAGADVMEGKAGDDRYIVDNALDKVLEAANGGTDTVEASVSFSLAGQFVEMLRLTGSEAINATGNGQANNLYGNAAANVIDGGAGDDRLWGGAGNDTLTGGAGLDRFIFDAPLQGAANVDRITDFSAADDGIYLSKAVFAAIGTGTLSAAAFTTGTAAADAADRIIHDSASGNIWYDADGSGAGAQLLFATVSAGTALTNADFIGF